MSYDIYLTDPKTGDVLQLEEVHQIKGGTYAIGGTTEAWMNVTYNYSGHFRRVLGEKGVRVIYGMTGSESIPILEDAISKLGDDVNDDYWKATEGNAKRALEGLLALAEIRSDGIWDGD